MVRGEAALSLAVFDSTSLEPIVAMAGDIALSHRLKARMLEALSLRPTIEGMRVNTAALSDPSRIVSMAAWDYSRRYVRALKSSTLDTSSGRSLVEQQRGLVPSTLRRFDPGLANVVGSLFTDTTVATVFIEDVSDGTIGAMREALGRLKGPDDQQSARALARALQALGDPEARTIEEERGVVERDPSLDREAGGEKAPLTLRMVTTKGTIRIRLLAEDAPYTVARIVRLVRNSFYDGLTFHRVVSNFVVQGGDPRGDGWGGPGYTMRTEVTPRNYRRGSVGMASAGKDTEGSQFFITHAPTVHLDARYTIFGEVISGIDVVDTILVGDTIDRIVVE
jgi:cyclophilin family peptidyl-prolyl cis-trans isomerase